MLNPYEIRKDFPIFERRIRGRPLVYLDSTATSQRPRQVIEAVNEFYRKYNANVHRGLHELSQEASEAYERAHEVIAKFINAYSWEEVVFVRNATEALNLVAYAWGMKNLEEGDEVVTTIMEHHSNLLPWWFICRLKKCKLKLVKLTNDYRLNYKELEESITERTKVVAVTHMSNVLGTINDVKRVVKIAKEVDAIVVLDGAQSVPHMPIDVRNLGVDFLAASGHKMLGPTGIGFLWGRKELLEEMNPFLLGGDMIKEVRFIGGKIHPKWNRLPWKFEAGTPNIAGGIGLAVAAEYLMRLGMENVRAHEVEIVKYLFKRIEEEELLSTYLRHYGPTDLKWKGGVFAFLLGDLDPNHTAFLLNLEGIAIRSGHHCAQPLHDYLGLTKGTARASFYIYTTNEDIDVFINALVKIVKAEIISR